MKSSFIVIVFMCLINTLFSSKCTHKNRIINLKDTVEMNHVVKLKDFTVLSITKSDKNLHEKEFFIMLYKISSQNHLTHVYYENPKLFIPEYIISTLLYFKPKVKINFTIIIRDQNDTIDIYDKICSVLLNDNNRKIEKIYIRYDNQKIDNPDLKNLSNFEKCFLNILNIKYQPKIIDNLTTKRKRRIITRSIGKIQKLIDLSNVS